MKWHETKGNFWRTKLRIFCQTVLWFDSNELRTETEGTVLFDRQKSKGSKKSRIISPSFSHCLEFHTILFYCSLHVPADLVLHLLNAEKIVMVLCVSNVVCVEQNFYCHWTRPTLCHLPWVAWIPHESLAEFQWNKLSLQTKQTQKNLMVTLDERPEMRSKSMLTTTDSLIYEWRCKCILMLLWVTLMSQS